MKKIIRLTESELHDLISRSVKRIIKEDVLGDNWHETQEDTVMNNYEPFESQASHNWSGVGDEDIDPTLYEPQDEVIGWNDDEPEGYDDDAWPEERVLDRIDTDANYDDFPPMK